MNPGFASNIIKSFQRIFDVSQSHYARHICNMFHSYISILHANAENLSGSKSDRIARWPCFMLLSRKHYLPRHFSDIYM